MREKIISVVISMLFILITSAQTNSLPIKEWISSSQLPFIFYVSGDGGFDNFSTELCTAINKAGYSITALNSKSYFWNKKTPAQTASDIASFLQMQFQSRSNQQLIITGYLFGSDVLPFIINDLPVSIKSKLIGIVMVSPSISTDFEVHWLDMHGYDKKRSMDVVAEINKWVHLKQL